MGTGFGVELDEAVSQLFEVLFLEVGAELGVGRCEAHRVDQGTEVQP